MIVSQGGSRQGVGGSGKGKKAAVNWTVGKLMQIVLAIVVLVLLIFGVSNGMVPSIEKIGGKFDQLSIMLNLKDDPFSSECYSDRVSGFLPTGKELATEYNLGDKVKFNICGEYCNFSGGLEEYRQFGGEFQKSLDKGKSWVGEDEVFEGDLDEIEFSWELYNEGIKFLEKIEQESVLLDISTKKFVLYGDGAGSRTSTCLVWQNGDWIMLQGGENPGEGWKRVGDVWKKERMIGYSTEKIIETSIKNDDEAIDKFVKIVDGAKDDNVYWKILDPTTSIEEYLQDKNKGKSIEDIVGDIGLFGSSFQLDSDEEVDNLKMAFAQKKVEFLKEAELSVEDKDRFEKAVDDAGGKIKVGEKEFSVGLDIDNSLGISRTVIYLVFGDERFAFVSSNVDSNNNFLDGAVLSKYPVFLGRWENHKWEEYDKEKYYRLNDVDFERVWKNTLVRNFMEEECR